MTRLVAILAAVVAIALVGGTYLFTRSGDDDQFAQCRGSAAFTAQVRSAARSSC